MINKHHYWNYLAPPCWTLWTHPLRPYTHKMCGAFKRVCWLCWIQPSRLTHGFKYFFHLHSPHPCGLTTCRGFPWRTPLAASPATSRPPPASSSAQPRSSSSRGRWCRRSWSGCSCGVWWASHCPGDSPTPSCRRAWSGGQTGTWLGCVRWSETRTRYSPSPPTAWKYIILDKRKKLLLCGVVGYFDC